MQSGISYKTGDKGFLDDIEALWMELNQMHLEKSSDFKRHYQSFTFQQRKQSLINHTKNGELLVVVSYCNDEKIGYCISSIIDEIGEIDSIYIQSNYRKFGIGNILMEMSLDWLKSNNVKKICVKVAAGNEDVFGFYSKYGFKPRLTELQLEL